MIWLIIVCMTVIIFISRYLFLEPRLPIKFNEKVLQFLSYAAPAVLTAIIGPLIFVKEHELYISINNKYLIGSVIACVLAYITKNTLLTVLVSMGVFFFVL